MQFGHILETFVKFRKAKKLVGPQVMPRSLALPNEAKWLQKRDVRLWKTWQLRSGFSVLMKIPSLVLR